ncbi:ABC transporter substrate-binding protein [Paenibacillus oryzae]|uniref:ABC transporter substrate-binding protein n=1 Tax=Paenibacillus oryzae TaxID=1844972 RepID=A0A1A5YBB5_9BACL|nr:ABC transporter substrate-binding protein [Paenibacillus oryzae]OBR62882.1 ABC transporter substrate-binding protein [Paenibacillus oryzae]
MKKKSIVTLSILILLAVFVAACGGNNANKGPSAKPQESASPESGAEQPASEETSGTVTYESETGPVEIPAKPARIVALTNAPNVLSLGQSLVGVDQWTGANPLFTDMLKDVAIVSEEDPEGVAAQNPDLIIAGSHMKNLDQLSKIAPTVVYTWGKLNYLDQQLEIGKLLNKTSDAEKWVNDFKTRATAIGQEIKAKHGDNVSVTFFEMGDNSVFTMGDSWARGTEIIYQAMGLTMPEIVKKDTAEVGYYSLSLEVLPEYSGDFIIVSRDLSRDNDILTSEVWKNIPAVQKNQVIEIESKASSYSDPTTLEYLLNIFEQGFLGQGQ